MKKKIIIAGGTGFLGKALTNYFHELGDTVTVLTRRPRKKNHIYWDGENTGDWVQCLNRADALINLAGKSVDCRYTEKNKKAILSSRLNSTRVLNEAVLQVRNPPKVWLNASSATTYIHAETQKMNEKNGIIGDDFSMNVCKQWEHTFFSQTIPRCRKIAMRTSIVLSEQGGAFPKIKMLTRLGFGGKQGHGNQMVSSIHIQDFCRAVHFIIQTPKLQGPVNITNPSPSSNANFMRSVRQRYKMPFGINISRPLIEIGAWIMGTESELLLKSRNVIPTVLLDAGFKFSGHSLSDFRHL